MVPLVTYGATSWKEAVCKQRYFRTMQSVQRLINIKIAKVYNTISFEASCLMAGVPPIGILKAGRVQLYKGKHGVERSGLECDMALPVKEWPHPARRVNIMDTSAQTTYFTEIYTDGSKVGGKVRAGIAIFSDKSLVRQCKYRLQICCSNNQTEQVGILKSLEQLPYLEDLRSRTVAIYTDSQVTLALLKNNSMHSFLIEEIRNKVQHLTTQNWSIGEGT
jgi:hypothetical protein